MVTENVLRKRLESTRPVLQGIGRVILDDVRNNFKQQKFDGRKWPARYPSLRGKTKINIAGVISDFKKGKIPGSKRFEGRPALKDTGALMRSFRISAEQNSVTVKSNVSYADVHQRGGDVSISITKPARKGLARLAARKKSIAPVIAKFINENRKDFTSIYKFKVVKRQMIGATRSLRKKMIKSVKETLEGPKRGNL